MVLSSLRSSLIWASFTVRVMVLGLGHKGQRGKHKGIKMNFVVTL